MEVEELFARYNEGLRLGLRCPFCGGDVVRDPLRLGYECTSCDRDWPTLGDMRSDDASQDRIS